MTLAVILAVGSLLGSSIAGAEPLPLAEARIQEQQSSDSKPPAQAPQAQDQSSPESERKQPPTKEAGPAQQPAEPPALSAGPETQEKVPSAEKTAEQPPSAEKSGAAKAPGRKAKHKKNGVKPSSGPKKTVVRDGGTAEPTAQLTPGMPQDQATHSQQTTTWLLSSTEANLKRAAVRRLSSNQQATVQQIKIFMDQANAAMKDGDFQRSHNLAMKAHLLSDDLLKH